MITFESVTFTYADSDEPVLRDVSLRIPEGELALVVGPTGSGKSTLLEMINGLVPHFTGGTLHGSVEVQGRSIAEFPPRDLADVVGLVRQDPQSGFVTDIVEDELAYVMESLAIAAPVMRRRVEETLDLLGLTPVRDRALRTMSGGQQQRVAIGSVLTANPRVLVLDEPTSALDPQAAEEVLSTLQRLVHDLGLTVVLSEHRLERAVQYADSVVLLDGLGHAERHEHTAAAMSVSPIAPPVVELGRWAGWQPLPLSIRDARRRAGSLRERLESHGAAPPPARSTPGGPVATVRGATVSYGTLPALRSASVSVAAGEILAVIGRNGSGKTTLLSVLAGSIVPTTGTVEVLGADPASLSGPELLSHLAYVPQEPQHLLWSESVRAECSAADRDNGLPPGTALELVERLRPGIDPAAHPSDLSEGSRLCLVLGMMLVAPTAMVLLDEPTRGLDYEAKRRLVQLLQELASDGRSILLATHDVELIAEVCTRVVMLADGEVVLDAPAREAMLASPVFAPQVGKIVAPLPYLTVAEVLAALDGDG
jgi:energy-coupling factor transport system ATP-binding protein